ncbi:hypothetical protein BKA64DRAFT_664437, partial [Cadophora sp. MPI-SDFR-AT-0126]
KRVRFSRWKAVESWRLRLWGLDSRGSAMICLFALAGAVHSLMYNSFIDPFPLFSLARRYRCSSEHLCAWSKFQGLSCGFI